MGVAVSTTVAEIAAGTLVAAAFGGVESVSIDLAVAQPLKIATGMQKGFSLDEINAAAKDGMIYGGVFGAAGGTAKAGIEGGLFFRTDGVPLMLRPPTLRPDLVEVGPAARPCKSTPCVGEPIDVATGAMLMTQTDLTLPAGLPLVFERTHLSSYRGGVCFGPTWVSTLDECLQIDGEGVVFAAADGMRLIYPVPQPDEPVLPVKGARWPLEWDGKPDGVMTVTDPDSGVVRTFSTPCLRAASVSSTSRWKAGTTATARRSMSSARPTASRPRFATPAATTSPSTPKDRASRPCACSTGPPRPTSRCGPTALVPARS